MSKAYWILPDGKIIDIGMNTHISYIISHPATFNTTKSKITKLYKKYNEIVPVEGIARNKIIMDLLNQQYIRIRQYKNHWSISLIILDDRTKARLSQWAELAIRIPNSGKYADVQSSMFSPILLHSTVVSPYCFSIPLIFLTTAA